VALLVAVTVLSVALTSVADERFRVEDVYFTADCDGTTQRYVRMLPKGLRPEVKHHVLIALHGHGSDRWQFASGTTPTGVAARNAAAERRMILILPDYRAKTSWMGPKAEADVCQIIGDIKREYATDKVFLCGGSMGGSSALTFAAIHPELIDGVAAMNGTANHLEYENFQDAIAASFGGPKSEIPAEYKKRSAEYWPERLTMPVGITASGKDAVVPPQSVVRLAGILERISRPVMLVYREDMGHTSKPEDAQRVIDFVLDRALRAADAGSKPTPDS
jgi:pimeloyl-ACP methyl ester carboxylesterase